MRRILCTVLLSWLCIAQLAARSILPPDAVLVDSATLSAAEAELGDRAAAALQALDAGDAEQALVRLREGADPVAFELAAAQILDRIQARSGHPADTVLIGALERTVTRVFRRHDESAAAYYLPVYDVAARARAARMLQQRHHAAAEWRRRVESDPHAAVVAAAGVDLPALRMAIEQLAPSDLEQFSRAAQKSPDRVPGAVWTTIASRRPQPEELGLALAYASPIDVLPLLAPVAEAAAPEVALDWLDRAIARPDLASAAIMALGRLSVRSEEAKHDLIAHLAREDTGPSAAAALASLGDASVIALVGSHAKSADPVVLRHLVLALRLRDTPAARNALQQMMRDTVLPATVRAELQR